MVDIDEACGHGNVNILPKTQNGQQKLLRKPNPTHQSLDHDLAVVLFCVGVGNEEY